MLEQVFEFVRNAALTVVALVTLFVDGCTPPPSDAEMIANFHRNREPFEMLREKLCSLPHSQTVWPESVFGPMRAKPELTEADMLWFSEIMSKVAAERVSSLPDPCMVWISAWTVGFAGGGDYKDYRFGPPLQEPMIELDDLDDVDRTSTEITFYQWRIEGDWWLQFEHWP